MLHIFMSHNGGYRGRVSDATELTIDELASRTGMTVRNVRAYQSRGLIPPPELRGRTGYYADEHVMRLELIRDLQAEGFNLEAIKRILDSAPGDSIAEVLDFTRAVAAPFGDERPQVVDAEAFVERWGEQLTPEVVRQAIKSGVVRDLGEGRYELLSPRLHEAAAALQQLGVPLDSAVNVTAVMRKHSEAVARAYVRLFLEHVWRPFEQAGEPAEDWTRVRDALERLRPLAGEALMAMFGLVMTEAVEQALERELARIGDDRRSASGSARGRSAGRSERPRKRTRR
jgi:DNA-binding transcriptional MerR regulator